MILIHELGHFLTARACGVGVYEFAIGMGPKIISRVSKKSGIRYSLRLFPIGGYVSMVGEDEESEAENSFDKANVFKRMLIILAGAFMNLLLGFIIMLVIVSGGDGTNSQTGEKLLASNVVAVFDEDAVSDDYGLKVGDKIIKVGNASVPNGYALSYEIMNRGHEALRLTVIRGGEKIVLEDVVFGNITESGVVFGDVDFKCLGETMTFGRVLSHTFSRSVTTVKMVWESLIDLLRGRYGLDAVSGPVGITEQVGEAAKSGIGDLLYICAIIAMNLGVVNLLPFPALDGFRFFFLIVEAVRGKPIKKEIENAINSIGILILLGLMLLISLKDIWGIFIR